MKCFDYPLISLGSPLSIGYEIFLKSLKNPVFKNNIPVCTGSENNLNFFAKLLNLKIKYIIIDKNKLNEIDIKNKNSDFYLINTDDNKYIIKSISSINEKIDGYNALKAINTAADMVGKDKFKSLVTMPVNKKNINIFDKNFFGHTEYFQKKWQEKEVYMTFISKKLNVILLTTHIPLNEVSKQITAQNINALLKASVKLSCKLNFKKGIMFLGFNPHAGENGLIGDEDLLIKKTIEKFNQKYKKNIAGPVPADTAFIKSNINKYDLYISCYHDQGLIPFKMLSFNDGVNLSFGMSFIRTSVDHGTAPDIIGKNVAESGSFINAYKLACKLI